MQISAYHCETWKVSSAVQGHPVESCCQLGVPPTTCYPLPSRFCLGFGCPWRGPVRTPVKTLSASSSRQRRHPTAPTHTTEKCQEQADPSTLHLTEMWSFGLSNGSKQLPDELPFWLPVNVFASRRRNMSNLTPRPKLAMTSLQTALAVFDWLQIVAVRGPTEQSPHASWDLDSPSRDREARENGVARQLYRLTSQRVRILRLVRDDLNSKNPIALPEDESSTMLGSSSLVFTLSVWRQITATPR